MVLTNYHHRVHSGHLGRDLRLNVLLAQQLAGATTSASLGVDWGLRHLRLRLGAGGSNAGDLRLGSSVAFGLGRGQGRERGRPWQMQRERRSQQGGVGARVFLDHDADGRFSLGDTPLPGVHLEINGQRQAAASDASGRVDAALAAHRHSDVGIAEGTLEDPFWVSASAGQGFVGRPGTRWTADFPVILTGEIDGTVFLERGGRLPGGDRREAANVQLELVDGDGEIVATCKSEFDGFYLFQRVRPGRYILRMAEEQARRLGVEMAPRAVELGGGEVVAGVELVASAKAS